MTKRSMLGLLAVGVLACGCRPARPEPAWETSRLVAALSSRDDDARRRAAVLLGMRGDAAALWPLARALGDPRWEVRVAAVAALTDFADPRADRALLAAAKDRHWWVQTAALKALAKRRPPGSAQAARLARDSGNDAVRDAGKRLEEALRRASS